MPVAELHPLIVLVWSTTIATAAILGWLTLSHLLNLRLFRDQFSGRYALFTGFGTLYALSITASFVPTSPELKSQIFRLMWILGGLSTAHWVQSLQSFLRADDPWLRRTHRLWLLFTLLPLGDLLLFGATGQSLLYTLEPRGTLSIVFAATGDTFTHRLAGDLMGAASIVLLLLSVYLLLRHILRTRPGEWLLVVGVLLTAVLALIEAGTAGSRLSYPVLYTANIIEAMRISWQTSRELSEQFVEAERTQHEQRALIDLQLEQLKLQSRMASVGEQTAQIGHDLRNPLTVVLSGLDLLEVELSSPTPSRVDQSHAIDLIRQALDQILVMVRRITGQARATSTPEPVHVRTIAADTAALCRHQLDGIDLQLDVADDLWIVADPVEVTQVLVNLVLNAADAVRAAPEQWIRVQSAPDPERVLLTVTDAGQRPPPAILRRMFKTRFTSKGTAGTGLGLSICASIVQKYQGTIAVDPSAANTTIRIELPRAAPPQG